MTTQIKATDIPRYRQMYTTKQAYKCAICGTPLAGIRTALDHSHKTGLLRGVLCSGCNSLEGIVLKGAQRYAKASHMIKTDYLQWLDRLRSYLMHFEMNPTGVVHPSFDLETGKQKPKKRVKRRKK